MLFPLKTELEYQSALPNIIIPLSTAFHHVTSGDETNQVGGVYQFGIRARIGQILALDQKPLGAMPLISAHVGSGPLSVCESTSFELKLFSPNVDFKVRKDYQTFYSTVDLGVVQCKI